MEYKVIRGEFTGTVTTTPKESKETQEYIVLEGELVPTNIVKTLRAKIKQLEENVKSLKDEIGEYERKDNKRCYKKDMKLAKLGLCNRSKYQLIDDKNHNNINLKCDKCGRLFCNWCWSEANDQCGGWDKGEDGLFHIPEHEGCDCCNYGDEF